jgi:hypothetical protein
MFGDQQIRMKGDKKKLGLQYRYNKRTEADVPVHVEEVDVGAEEEQVDDDD